MLGLFFAMFACLSVEESPKMPMIAPTPVPPATPVPAAPAAVPATPAVPAVAEAAKAEPATMSREITESTNSSDSISLIESFDGNINSGITISSFVQNYTEWDLINNSNEQIKVLTAELKYLEYEDASTYPLSILDSDKIIELFGGQIIAPDGNMSITTNWAVNPTSPLRSTWTFQTESGVMIQCDFSDSPNSKQCKIIAPITPEPTLPALTAPYFKPIGLQGTGKTATGFFELQKGLWNVKLGHSGDSNFAVIILDSNGKYIDLLANEIGSFSGETSLSIEDTGEYLLDIDADGSWAVAFESPYWDERTKAPLEMDYVGKLATQFIELEEGIWKVKLNHSGDSNFAVKVLDSNGGYVDLLANEIGSFEGSTALSIKDRGLYVFDVDADGIWSIEIQYPDQPFNEDSNWEKYLKAPLTINNTGNTATNFIELEKGLWRVNLNHSGDSNFAVTIFDSDGNYVDLLANEIGPFEGSTALSIKNTGKYLLDIDADGIWSIDIQSP
tara:strand:+ start:60 stop:1565 length:1506 start_codon:yes stop_codon:yes gene_type:complete